MCYKPVFREKMFPSPILKKKLPQETCRDHSKRNVLLFFFSFFKKNVLQLPAYRETCGNFLFIQERATIQFTKKRVQTLCLEKYVTISYLQRNVSQFCLQRNVLLFAVYRATTPSLLWFSHNNTFFWSAPTLHIYSSSQQRAARDPVQCPPFFHSGRHFHAPLDNSCRQGTRNNPPDRATMSSNASV